MQIPIPNDSEGRIGRMCPRHDCSPGYFRVKLGTGITEGQQVAYCPYCRQEGAPRDFATEEQTRYAKDVMIKEAQQGIEGMIKDAFGIGSSGRRRLGGGLLSMELSYKPSSPSHVQPPHEDVLQRVVMCPNCGLDHAVFGLAFWCPDCGLDIFMTHVGAEYGVVKTMLSDVDRRKTALGARIGARDLENCLEDVVSIYETVLKVLFIRTLRERGKVEDEIQDILKKQVRNVFQNVNRSAEIIEKELGVSLFDPSDAGIREKLTSSFEKRHPITHNLGVVDRKYLEKALSEEREGREINITYTELTESIDIALKVLGSLHGRLFLKDSCNPK